MLYLQGSPAHSAFRLQKLLAQCRAQVPAIQAVHADYLHLVEVESALSDDERDMLERLLEYGAACTDAPVDGLELLVVPRPGTISPWSTKATDILHNCGLDKVRRVERGVRYRLQTAGDAGIDAAQRASILPLLHDRMTESVLFDTTAADVLFRHAVPQPSATVDVLAGGETALEAANKETESSILISEDVRMRAGDEFGFGRRFELDLRGTVGLTVAHEVLGYANTTDTD